MIISQESPFRNIPINLDAKQVVIFDAIRYSIDISEISYERLIKNLFELSFPQNSKTPSFPLIFLDVWSIISNLTIFLNVVTKHFSISESNPLFEQIRILKHLRHSNQHIEDRLDFIINPDQFPIYGKLSWYAQESVDSIEGVIISLYPGSVTNKRNVKPEVHNPSGRNNDKLINGIEFTGMVRINNQLNEKTINIHDILRNISDIINYFEKQIEQQLSQNLEKGKQVSDIILKLIVQKHKIIE